MQTKETTCLLLNKWLFSFNLMSKFLRNQNLAACSMLLAATDKTAESEYAPFFLSRRITIKHLGLPVVGKDWMQLKRWCSCSHSFVVKWYCKRQWQDMQKSKPWEKKGAMYAKCILTPQCTAQTFLNLILTELVSGKAGLYAYVFWCSCWLAGKRRRWWQICRAVPSGRFGTTAKGSIIAEEAGYSKHRRKDT